jgi:hypothetical protein
LGPCSGSVPDAPAPRRATVVSGDHLPPRIRTLVGDSRQMAPIAEELGRYLADPDSAVVASGLIGALAAKHGLRSIAPGAAYLTGDEAHVDPALDWFEIGESLPFDIKRLKALLRQRRIGRLEIKQRGAGTNPDQLRRQLHLAGDEMATLILVRRGKRVMVLLAQRVARASWP